jgi:hypothetical protein
MKSVLASLLLTAVVCFHPSPAFAQGSGVDRPWSAWLTLGWDDPISGNLIDGAIGTVAGEAAVIEPRSYRDVFGNGLQWRAGVGYLLSPDTEVLASLSYAVSSGEPLAIGTGGSNPLFADFSDHQEFGIEGAYRRYFASRDRWRPYAGAAIGLAFVDRIQSNFTIPNAGVVLTSLDFYDNSTAFTLGANGGVLYEVNDYLEVGGDLGLRWRSGLSENEILTGTGLERINDNSDRWTLPFGAAVRVRF